MNVACPECRSVFRVDPSKVPAAGVRARCSVCGGVITVGRSGTAEAWELSAPAREVVGAGTAAGAAQGESVGTGRGVSRGDAATAVVPPQKEDAYAATATRQPAGGRFSAPFVSPPRAASVPPGRPVLPPATPPRGSVAIPPRAGTPVVPPGVGGSRPTARPTPARPAAPAGPPSPQAGSFPAPSATAAPRVPSAAAPASSPAPSTTQARPEPTQRPPAQSSPAQSSVAPPAARATSGAPVGDRRPINPFLANDPNQKARRLARALVSDMITYQPQKRDEGARNGTLKQLFRDEIKKSYEEYVDQVGKELADSTTHFQDALNELLAGGKKIF